MKDIQTIAVENFSNNLLFLQKYDNELYERVTILSQLIETQEYTPRYDLEYITQEQEFDIYDLVNKSYVYKKTPSKFIKEAVGDTNFDKQNSIELLNSSFFNNTKEFETNSIENLGELDAALVKNDIKKYVDIFKSSVLKSDKKFKYLEKFVFVGSLLGSHILPIHKKIKAGLYFICEHNLEIFRLSLFVAPYYELSVQSKIIFSIMDDPEVFNEKFGKYYDEAFKSNYMIKYFCTNYNIHNYFERMISTVSVKSTLSYSYRMILEGLLKPKFYNMVKYPVLNTKMEHNLLKGKRVLVLAAGPSLGKNLEWIKNNQDDFFIISIGATIEKLINSDIKIDLIVSIDADKIILSQFPEYLHKKISKIPFLADTATHQEILNVFDPDNICLVEIMGLFKNTSEPFFGYSVGEIALNMASALGSKEIYLLGTDLALDQETGDSHIDGHDLALQIDMDGSKREYNSFMNGEKFDLGRSTIRVKGNFKKEVVTTIGLSRSIGLYNKSIKAIVSKSPETTIYNLCDGVYFNGTIPKRIEDINYSNIDNSLESKEIISYFKTNSEMGFNESEKSAIFECISSIDEMILKLNGLKAAKCKSYLSFLEYRVPIMKTATIEFSKYKLFYLDRLYIYYILTIESYLGYQFNQDIPNEASLVKKVKRIWCDQMLELSNEYKKVLKNIIE